MLTWNFSHGTRFYFSLSALKKTITIWNCYINSKLTCLSSTIYYWNFYRSGSRTWWNFSAFWHSFRLETDLIKFVSYIIRVLLRIFQSPQFSLLIQFNSLLSLSYFLSSFDFSSTVQLFGYNTGLLLRICQNEVHIYVC